MPEANSHPVIDHKTAAAVTRARADILHAWAHLADAAGSLPIGHPLLPTISATADDLRAAHERMAIDLTVGVL